MASKGLYFKTRKEWKEWLEKNYDKKNEVWMLRYKKHTKKQCISYEDSVEVAICFGWIDGLVNSIDENSYKQRFTPRRANSVWSLLNKNRAEKMIKNGEMTEAGLKTIEDAKKSNKWQNAYTLKKNNELPADLKKALMKNETAWRNFQNFSLGTKKFYILWINSSNKKETRANRIKKVVEKSEQNKRTIGS